MIRIEPEPPEVAPLREALLDQAFGPSRLAKTAQRLRHGKLPVSGLSFVATDAERLVGTIRFWHVRIGAGLDGLLLGPVAVACSYHGRGIGAALIGRGLDAARLAYRAILLVGDEAYYQRFGFRAELARRVTLPGPVDPRRVLGLELDRRALEGASGLVRPSGPCDPACGQLAA